MAFEVPAAAGRLLTADVAAEIARTFGDQPVYPQRIVVDCPAGSSPAPPGFSRRFPGWPGPVLVLCDENQGACSWGVPSGSGEVVVGGDLLDAGRATVVYAASVAGFIAARRWDQRCLDTGPVLQAQAAELDRASLGYLRARLAPAVATAGWPGSREHRFEGRGVQVMLWAQAGQCDWWISAASAAALRRFTVGLLDLPGVGQALWSNQRMASGCSATCAASSVNRATAGKAKPPGKASRGPAPPEITHRSRSLNANRRYGRQPGRLGGHPVSCRTGRSVSATLMAGSGGLPAPRRIRRGLAGR